MKNNIDNEYGHCHYCVCKDNDCAMIYNLYVKKSHRRKGHARNFIRQAINNITKTGYGGNIKIVAEPEDNSIPKKTWLNFMSQ